MQIRVEIIVWLSIFYPKRAYQRRTQCESREKMLVSHYAFKHVHTCDGKLPCVYHVRAYSCHVTLLSLYFCDM